MATRHSPGREQGTSQAEARNRHGRPWTNDAIVVVHAINVITAATERCPRTATVPLAHDANVPLLHAARTARRTPNPSPLEGTPRPHDETS